MSYADIEVDPKWHRHIIGKAGSNIGRIKTDTGTSINIPSDTTKSAIIRIEGSPEGVAAAKEEILEMAKKFVCTIMFLFIPNLCPLGSFTHQKKIKSKPNHLLPELEDNR